MIETPQEPQDERIEHFEANLEQVKGGISSIDTCLDAVPSDYRDQVRKALLDATVMGALLGDLKRTGVPPPIDEEGQVILGRALREHIKHARELHSQRIDLEQKVYDRLSSNDSTYSSAA